MGGANSWRGRSTAFRPLLIIIDAYASPGISLRIQIDTTTGATHRPATCTGYNLFAIDQLGRLVRERFLDRERQR